MIGTEETARREALDQRVREFHGAGLDEVLETISYLREDNDSAIVGGSLAYGLGNHRSDLDIVVVGPNIESSSRMPLEHWIDRLRVDVWKLKQGEIDELFVRAHEALGAEGPFDGVFGDVLEQADLKLLHRLAYGVVIDGSPLEPSGTRDYRDIARDVVAREYAERMRECAFVAQVAATGGRDLPAVMNARLAVENALQAVIASLGLPFSDNKWLQLRLDTEVTHLRPLYQPFAVLPDDPARTEAFVEAALETCTSITGLDLDVAALAAHAEWMNTDLQVVDVPNLRALLSLKDGAVWELDDEDVAVWGRLDVGEARPAADCDEATMKMLFELYSAGGVTLRWTRGLPIGELTIGEVTRA